LLYRHLQQLEARSRRRSGPRARVRDTALHTTSTYIHLAITSETLESPAPDVPNIALSSRTPTRPRRRIATDIQAVKDKAQHAVVLDKQTNDKLQKDVQSYRLITVATLVDRLKINGSLARKALADLEANGQIKKVVGHSKLSIYTRAVGAAE
jgi:small subunit ribosomal protein S25e